MTGEMENDTRREIVKRLIQDGCPERQRGEKVKDLSDEQQEKKKSRNLPQSGLRRSV
jgi:hypothetical protein